MQSFIGLAVALLLVASRAQAWSDHHRITRQALGSLPALEGRTVVAQPFETALAYAPELLRDLGYDPGKTFNETIQIRKDFRYLFRAGETAGQPVAAIDVLS